jgi:general stress protein 26
MTNHADPRIHLFELVTKFRTAMLVTRTPGDQLRARPLSLAHAHDEGLLYFATSLDSPKVDEVMVHPDVLVTMQDSQRYVSIAGAARICREPALIDRLWSESWRIWFPQGKADPALCILAVAPRSAEYWDQSGAKGIKYLVEMATAYVRGTTPASGGSSDNAKVRF